MANEPHQDIERMLAKLNELADTADSLWDQLSERVFQDRVEANGIPLELVIQGQQSMEEYRVGEATISQDFRRLIVAFSGRVSECLGEIESDSVLTTIRPSGDLIGFSRQACEDINRLADVASVVGLAAFDQDRRANELAEEHIADETDAVLNNAMDQANEEGQAFRDAAEQPLREIRAALFTIGVIFAAASVSKSECEALTIHAT